jgi:hypothetical protein
LSGTKIWAWFEPVPLGEMPDTMKRALTSGTPSRIAPTSRTTAWLSVNDIPSGPWTEMMK